jgi:choline-sulfatase
VHAGVGDDDDRLLHRQTGWRYTLEADMPDDQYPQVELVNPHDVLFYPRTWDDADYDRSWFKGEIDLAATVDENLTSKPDSQAQFVKVFGLGSGVLPTKRRKRNYLNYYANLMKSSDGYLLRC